MAVLQTRRALDEGGGACDQVWGPASERTVHHTRGGLFKGKGEVRLVRAPRREPRAAQRARRSALPCTHPQPHTHTDNRNGIPRVLVAGRSPGSRGQSLSPLALPPLAPVHLSPASSSWVRAPRSNPIAIPAAVHTRAGGMWTDINSLCRSGPPHPRLVHRGVSHPSISVPPLSPLPPDQSASQPAGV